MSSQNSRLCTLWVYSCNNDLYGYYIVLQEPIAISNKQNVQYLNNVKFSKGTYNTMNFYLTPQRENEKLRIGGLIVNKTFREINKHQM